MNNVEVIAVTGDSLSIQDEQEIVSLCLEAEKEVNQPMYKNMEVKAWRQKPNTLLFKIFRERAYDIGHGSITLLRDYEKNCLIGISCVYRSDFDPYVFVGGVRTWIRRPYRNNLYVVKYMLPTQLHIAKTLGARTFILTFNAEMNVFADLVARVSMKEAGKKSNFFFGKEVPDFYRDIQLHPKPVVIKNTLQTVLIKKIDPNYNPSFPEVA